MPVIVVGADTPIGEAVVTALVARGGEIRAFVSDSARVASLRAQGVKVAVGDLSDGSHLTAAAHNAFTAVLVEASILDGRTLNFASDAADVVQAWQSAIRDAGVQRAIWVGDRSPPDLVGRASEIAVVSSNDRPDREIAGEVADLNDRDTLFGM
jgi:uncharacterized protein YbjT (DUF2867 family)